PTGRATYRPCHRLVGILERDELRRRWVATTTRITTDVPQVNEVTARAVHDLASLRIRAADLTAGGDDADGECWVPAGGIPWYLTLFGRDALVTSLQT